MIDNKTIQQQLQNNLNEKLRSGAYVRVLKESGFYEALFGLSLSFDVISPEVITGESNLLSNEKFLKMQKVAQSWEILESKGKREYLLFWRNNLKSKWDKKQIESELNDLTFNEVMKK